MCSHPFLLTNEVFICAYISNKSNDVLIRFLCFTINSATIINGQIHKNPIIRNKPDIWELSGVLKMNKAELFRAVSRRKSKAKSKRSNNCKRFRKTKSPKCSDQSGMSLGDRNRMSGNKEHQEIEEEIYFPKEVA